MEITLIYVADADIMTIAVTVISEPFVDSIKSLLNGGSHFDAVLFNNLRHENKTTTTIHHIIKDSTPPISRVKLKGS